jgi:hypothetical protein
VCAAPRSDPLQNESGTSGQCSGEVSVRAVHAHRAEATLPITERLGPIHTCQAKSVAESQEMRGQEKLIHTALAPFGYECPCLCERQEKCGPILVGDVQRRRRCVLHLFDSI